jgi:hypothetical protein
MSLLGRPTSRLPFRTSSRFSSFPIYRLEQAGQSSTRVKAKFGLPSRRVVAYAGTEYDFLRDAQDSQMVGAVSRK